MGEKASGVLIRPASAEDTDSIYEIGTLCFPDAWRRKTVAHDMEGDHSEYFVADLNGEVVGYGCFWFVVDEGQLVNIGVRPECRKRGYAEAILKRGLEECKARNMKTIFLEARVSNSSALALYKKYNFRSLGVRKGVYDLPREDGYIMSREI